MPLPAATLPIYPGLGQAQECAGLYTPMAWLHLDMYTVIFIARNVYTFVSMLLQFAPASSGDVQT